MVRLRPLKLPRPSDLFLYPLSYQAMVIPDRGRIVFYRNDVETATHPVSRTSSHHSRSAVEIYPGDVSLTTFLMNVHRN